MFFRRFLTPNVFLGFVVFSLFSGVGGFSVAQMRARSLQTKLQASAFSDREGEALLRQRTCIRHLLTQRAIQSFMDLLISIRDPHTADWLQTNLNTNNLEFFHGTGAFNMTLYPTWDSVLLDLLSKPNDTVIITTKSKRAAGGGGWRGQIGGWAGGQSQEQQERTINPHLEERIVETKLDIDPVSLVSRILSVREQLGREFVDDFATLICANDQILASYFETQEDYRLEDLSDTAEYRDNNDSEEEEDDDSATLMVPYSISPNNRAFNRHLGDILLSNTIYSKDRDSSPLRKGNFDLVLLLLTQESVHRVLRSYAKSGDEREVSFDWLLNFYKDRVEDYFDGHQRYGRADDFLEELLLTPPVMKTLSNGDGRKEMVGLVDPLRIAEDVIKMRSEVGEEWKDIIANVPNEHIELRKLLLAKQMGKHVDLPTGAAGTMDFSEGSFQ